MNSKICLFSQIRLQIPKLLTTISPTQGLDLEDIKNYFLIKPTQFIQKGIVVGD